MYGDGFLGLLLDSNAPAPRVSDRFVASNSVCGDQVNSGGVNGYGSGTLSLNSAIPLVIQGSFYAITGSTLPTISAQLTTFEMEYPS
jgi:hypothetical protein